MAEQFALEQVGGNRAAVDRHEGMPRPARQLVHVPRGHFLARARLAENEHVGVVGGDLFDQTMHRAHGARGAAGTEPVGTGLRGMAVAHVLRLVQDGREPALLDRKIQVKPGEVAAGFRQFRQPVGTEINERQRQRHAAQIRHQFLTLGCDGLLAHDQGQPVVRFRGVVAAELRQIVQVDRLEIQKPQQGFQVASL